MFGKKLIIVAAAVALAMGHVAAMEEAAHVKVSAHHHKVVSHKAQHHKKPVVAHKAMRHHKQVTETPAPAEADGHAAAADDDDDAESDSEDSTEHDEETPDVEIDILAGGDNSTSTESHHHDHTEEEVSFCLPNWTEVSVEGVEDIFCVEGQVCVDQIKDGACPSQQAGLPLGSYCDIVKTGVYGCKPVTKEMTEHENSEYTPVCTGEGESPMSVEGVEGVFCVTGQACVADIKDGACPVAQEGLEYGAYCDKVKTGVYGCKPMHKHEHEHEHEHGHGEETEEIEETVVDIDVCTGKDESPMSVEGVEGVFCVAGQACVADIKDGACPDAQEGLEYGAYCGTVKTGVYGCKPKSKEMYEHEEVPTEHEHEHEHEHEGAETDESDDLCTGEGESPMSVEGVEGIFCVTGQACVADIKDGACPAEQDGLQWGAYCDKVKTGVYGCKPVTEEMYKQQHAGGDHEEGDAAVDTGAPECKGEGQSPMSVEGVEGIFCVTGQACVADIDGACPAAQEGLEYGAHCGTVASGVKGCKPNTSKHMMKMFAKKSKAQVATAKHHSKSTTAAKKGHSIKVVKVHAAKKTVHKKTQPVVAKKTVRHQKKTHKKKSAHHKIH